jgi:hypothetical protein
MKIGKKRGVRDSNILKNDKTQRRLPLSKFLTHFNKRLSVFCALPSATFSMLARLSEVQAVFLLFNP